MADAYTSIDFDALAMAAFKAYNAELTPFNAFSRSYSADVASKGASVTVPVIAAATAAAFGASGYEVAGDDIAAIQVNVGTHLVASFSISDVQAGATNYSTLLEKSAQASKAVAKLAQQLLWADITSTTWGTTAFSTVGTAAGFDSDDLIDVRTACTAADMPRDNRSVILDEAYYGALLKDSGFKNALNYGGTEAIRGGRIPNAFGFSIYESTIVPSNSENMVGIACTPDAYAVAIRLPDPNRNTGPGLNRTVNWRAMTDDETGASLGMRVHADEKLGKLWVSFEILYGFEDSNVTGSLRRLVSA